MHTIALNPQSLSEIATADPDAVAVAAGGVELTNRELDSWSNRIARMLLAMGAGSETTVAVCLVPSIESVVTMWAVTKIGAALTVVDTAGGVRALGATIGVTTKAHRAAQSDAIDWLVLDDRATVVRYLAGTDAPLSATELGIAIPA